MHRLINSINLLGSRNAAAAADADDGIYSEADDSFSHSLGRWCPFLKRLLVFVRFRVFQFLQFKLFEERWRNIGGTLRWEVAAAASPSGFKATDIGSTLHRIYYKTALTDPYHRANSVNASSSTLASQAWASCSHVQPVCTATKFSLGRIKLFSLRYEMRNEYHH